MRGMQLEAGDLFTRTNTSPTTEATTIPDRNQDALAVNDPHSQKQNTETVHDMITNDKYIQGFK